MKVLALILVVLVMVSVAVAGDLKVMRAINYESRGSNCRVIDEGGYKAMKSLVLMGKHSVEEYGKMLEEAKTLQWYLNDGYKLINIQKLPLDRSSFESYYILTLQKD